MSGDPQEPEKNRANLPQAPETCSKPCSRWEQRPQWSTEAGGCPGSSHPGGLATFGMWLQGAARLCQAKGAKANTRPGPAGT